MPTVILPWFTDSVANAARCADAGLGAVVPKTAITPESVRAACTRVLSDPSYRAGAASMRRHMLALPAVEELVADIEGLCGHTDR